MATSDASSVLTKLPHVSRRLAGETMLLAIDSPHELPIRLNFSGSDLWDRLDTGIGVRSMNEHESTLVDALMGHRLLTWSPHETAPNTHEAVARSEPRGPDATNPRQPGSDNDFWTLLRTFDVRAAPPTPESMEDVCAAEGLDQAELLSLVERAGAIGQLAHAIDGGFIETDAASRAVVQERWAANQLHCLRVERLLVQVARILDDADVEFRVLKGVAVAHLDYPDPSYREFGDVDILVDERVHTDVVELLTSADIGLTTRAVHPLSKKGATLITPDLIMVDLHYHLAVGSFGVVDTQAIFEDCAQFELGGRQIPAMSSAARLIHAALHKFASPAIRPGTMRDFTELEAVSHSEVAHLASSLRYTAVVKKELRGMGARHDELYEALHPTRLERLLAMENSWVSYSKRPVWREASGLALTPGFRGRIGYVTSRLSAGFEYKKRTNVSWSRVVARRFDRMTRRVRRQPRS